MQNMHATRPAQSSVAQSLAPRVAGLVVRALVGGRVEQIVDGRTLDQLAFDGMLGELDYMTPSERFEARGLEAELLDAAAEPAL